MTFLATPYTPNIVTGVQGELYLCLLLMFIIHGFCDRCFECVCVEVLSGDSECFFASVYRTLGGKMKDFLGNLKDIFEYIDGHQYSAITYISLEHRFITTT